ncbi:MAG: hypothetical protein ABJI22_03325, partial [Maribacter sp.]
MKFSSLINILSLLFLSLFLSCSSDDDSIVNEKLPEEEVVEEEIQEPETPVEVVYPIQGETGTILLNNKPLSQEGYVLVNE